MRQIEFFSEACWFSKEAGGRTNRALNVKKKEEKSMRGNRRIMAE